MKKIMPFISFLLLFFMFSGCGSKSGKETPALHKIEDYYPKIGNTRYTYIGDGNEYASYSVYTDYISEFRLQERVDSSGTVLAKVIEIKNKKVHLILSREEAYYRENLLEKNGENREIILMEPVKVGTTWTLSASRTRTITGTSVDITTPSGNYKAIEVTTQGPDYKTINYYAKNIGLVKSVFVSRDTRLTSSLSRVERNIPLMQNINFYYPNIEDGKIYYKEKEVIFRTNDITRKVLENVYKELPNSSIGDVFSSNTEINSLYLNRDGIVYIDFNRAFLTEMNAGSGYESMILQSIVNTFGNYYNSKKVILTIDNKLYESGHIALEKGEYFKVKTDDTIEIKDKGKQKYVPIDYFKSGTKSYLPLL
ncbi:GerMN domain-containing protein [uncultured Ilyobacter sp.]|uniref:GerMN domain-containing protein n=1 Tax=uncultured Ilyobacter sp. TaxID=544433 RepID=UPI0029C7811E|nr:GerMN domain-containing protein [uncultured Ilyobacter sp.]